MGDEGRVSRVVSRREGGRSGGVPVANGPSRCVVPRDGLPGLEPQLVDLAVQDLGGDRLLSRQVEHLRPRLHNLDHAHKGQR